MTRINLLPVKLLLDQHLLAEYRELPMIGAALKKSLDVPGDLTKRIPPHYTLGTGHVMFFYNKLPFLERRWDELITELKRRKFKIDEDSRNPHFKVFKKLEQIDWTPTKSDIVYNVCRILERVHEKPNWYKYKGVVCTNYKVKLFKRMKAHGWLRP